MRTKNKLKSFLVKELKLSNKEVLKLLLEKKVILNGKTAAISSFMTNKDGIKVNGKIIQQGIRLIYIKFNKPRGIESTLNKKIRDNLTTIFTFKEKLFPVGRLDKESEGLMIFTNDGEYYKRVTDKDKNIEKEYIVEVDRTITEEFLQQMRSGVKIMGKMTKECKVSRQSAVDPPERAKPFVRAGSRQNRFNIILTEGMNRQIRRMCYKLGYEVLSLKRIRIENIELGNLRSGKKEEINF